MKTPREKSRITVTIDLVQLDEKEIRALDALAGYGTDEFINQFYKVMGRCYLEPHVAGLRTFLDGIRPVARDAIHRIDAARKTLQI